MIKNNIVIFNRALLGFFPTLTMKRIKPIASSRQFIQRLLLKPDFLSSNQISVWDQLCSLRENGKRLPMNLHNTLMSLIPAFTFHAAAHSVEMLPFPPLCPGIPPHPQHYNLESVSLNHNIWNSVVMNSKPYSSTCRLVCTTHLWIPICLCGTTGVKNDNTYYWSTLTSLDSPLGWLKMHFKHIPLC